MLQASPRTPLTCLGFPLWSLWSPWFQRPSALQMKILKLATRMLRRNWSAGELRVLLFAILIAVASVTTVAFFADRVQSALDRQANELLGGDLVVIADKPIPPEFAQVAARDKLVTARTRTFPNMVSAPGGVNLAEVKAVSERFPLRGRLRIKDAGDAPEHEVDGGPRAGSVWIGLPLAARIDVKVGDMLQVGRA